MSRVKITHPNIVQDSLAYLDPATKTHKALAKGMLCGMVAMLMAQGKSFDEALVILRPYLPKNINPEAIPENWKL